MICLEVLATPLKTLVVIFGGSVYSVDVPAPPPYMPKFPPNDDSIDPLPLTYVPMLKVELSFNLKNEPLDPVKIDLENKFVESLSMTNLCIDPLFCMT